MNEVQARDEAARRKAREGTPVPLPATDIKELRQKAHALDQQVKALRDEVKRYAEENRTKDAWDAYGALNSATYDTFGAFGALCKEGERVAE